MDLKIQEQVAQIKALQARLEKGGVWNQEQAETVKILMEALEIISWGNIKQVPERAIAKQALDRVRGK